MGAFSTAHSAELCIHTWGTHDLHSVTPLLVLLVQSTFILFFSVFHTELLVSSQEYNIQTPYLSVHAVHRVPLHKSTKNTSI